MKIKSKSGQGIQLRLLGGTLYLQDGCEAEIEDRHLEHYSIQNAIRTGDLEVLPTEAETLSLPDPVADVEQAEDETDVISTPTPKSRRSKRGA